MLDDNVGSLPDDAASCKVTREWPGRAPCCWILPDAHSGVEESRVSGGSRIGRLEAKQIASLSAQRLKKGGKTLSVRPGAVDYGAVSRRHEQVRCPRRNDLCGEPINQEIGFVDAEGGRQGLEVGAHRTKERRGLDHPYGTGLTSVGDDLNRQDPLPEFLRECGMRRIQGKATRLGQPPPGAQRVVTCAEHFGA